jgi:hypothetical protein
MATTNTVERLKQQLDEEKEEQYQAIVELVKTPAEQEAATRHMLAMWCTIGYFSTLILILIGVPLYNYWAAARRADLILSLKDTLLVYQAVVGTLVGAVVAYYFKTQLDKNNEQ